MRHIRAAFLLSAAINLLCTVADGQSQPPVISKGGVVNAADGSSAIAPGTLVSIYGSNLAAALRQAPSVPLPLTMDQVAVDVQNGSQTLSAPLWFISAGQINAQIPFGVGSSVTVRVRTARGTSAWEPVTIAPRAPRLFTVTQDGRGQPLAFHSNYDLVTASSPAKPGEYLFCYVNGMGGVDPGATSGAGGGDGTAAAPLNRVTDDVAIIVNGAAAPAAFAGLAPYFVGVYQVNFQVPDTPGGTSVPLVVRVGQVQSQSSVSIAYSGTWQPLGSATVTASGATLTTSGMSVKAAAGAIVAGATLLVNRAQPPAGTAQDPSQVSDLYAIDGLSTRPGASVELRLNLNQAPDPSAYYQIVVQEQGAHGPNLRFVPATLQGNQVVADLVTASTSPGHSAAMQPEAGTADAGDTRSLAHAHVTKDAGYWLSKKGKFRMWKPDKNSTPALDSIASDLLDMLDSSSDYLETQVKMSFARRNTDPNCQGCPIEVYLYRFGGWPFAWLWESNDMWGYQESSKLGPSYHTLSFNLNKVYDGSKVLTDAMPTMKLTVAHELFHLLQTLYDPRPNDQIAKSGGPWYWTYEAASTWLEKTLSTDPNYISSTVKPVPGSNDSSDNYSAFLKHGLAYPGDAGGKCAQEHGYGASMFLHQLVNRYGGPSVVGRLFALEAGPLANPPKPAVSPVEAIQQVASDLSGEWRTFLGNYMAGTVYPSGPLFPTPSLLGAANASGAATITPPGSLQPMPDPVTFVRQAQDLSAREYVIAITKQPSAGVKFQVSLDDPGSAAEAIVYKHSGTSWTRLPGSAKAGSPLSLDATQFQALDVLDIMVTNGRAVKPYDQMTNITLKVGLDDPSARRDLPYFSVSVNVGDQLKTDYAGKTTISSWGTVSIANTVNPAASGCAAPQICPWLVRPLVWMGDSVASDTGKVTWQVDSSTKAEGSVSVTGQLDAAKNLLSSLAVKFHQLNTKTDPACTVNTVDYVLEISVTNLPLTYSSPIGGVTPGATILSFALQGPEAAAHVQTTMVQTDHRACYGGHDDETQTLVRGTPGSGSTVSAGFTKTRQ